MEFTIKQSVLRDALQAVAGCIEKSRVIPVLNNVLVESIGENGIRITATNMDITIRRDAEAEISKPGAICIEGQKLFEVTRALPACDMRFAKEPNAEHVRLVAGKSKARFLGRKKDDFPETPQFKSTPIRIPGDSLRALIAQTVFAISKEPSRYVIDGVKLEVDDDWARMVATDGNRLAVADAGCEGTGLGVLIPRKALAELAKLASADTVSIGEDRNHLFAETPGALLVARKLIGSFPNYAVILNKLSDKPRTITFNTQDMLAAAKRASLFASDISRALYFDIRPNEVAITAKAADRGEAEEQIEIDYDGPAAQFLFQYPFVLEFLSVISDQKECCFAFSEDASELTVLNAVGDQNYRYILVPQNAAVVERQEARAIEEAKDAKQVAA